MAGEPEEFRPDVVFQRRMWEICSQPMISRKIVIAHRCWGCGKETSLLFCWECLKEADNAEKGKSCE